MLPLLLLLGFAAPAPPPVAEPAPKLYLCAGASGGAYHQTAQRLAERLKGLLTVEIQATRGSWENLEAIDAVPRRCDAIIAQDDAFALYRYEHPESRLMMDRLASLFPEYVHLFCRRGIKADELEDLTSGRVVIGEYGSGAYITWKLFARLNPAYHALSAEEAPLEEGARRAAEGRADCVLVVSAWGLGAPARIDAQHGARLKLLDVSDDRLTRPVGTPRRPLYRAVELRGAVYPNVKREEVETYAVDAAFFASPEWRARFPEASRVLDEALKGLLDELKRENK
ncbi:hypothetical protein KKF91_01795 [Myxococcota bacterium]|nr:hypothetical protein [Myxococcota bacterium]MBU1429269.1 hypothetical protein [Myxococcota bacterium]MBU1897289.1 hypothetical protein [Myxococcota bacterium]